MKIRHLSFILVVAAVLLVTELTPVSAFFLTKTSSGDDMGVSAVYASSKYVKCKKMYKKINKFRTKKKQWQWKKGSKKKQYFNTKKSNKLKKLKRDKALEKTAKKRAKELYKYFDHTRPNGKSCFTVYPKKFKWMGENIAYSGAECSIDEIMEGWIEEDMKYGGQGHRRNMLNKHFKKVGVACFEKGGVRYWVQCFGG